MAAGWVGVPRYGVIGLSMWWDFEFRHREGKYQPRPLSSMFKMSLIDLGRADSKYSAHNTKLAQGGCCSGCMRENISDSYAIHIHTLRTRLHLLSKTIQAVAPTTSSPTSTESANIKLPSTCTP